MIKKGSYIQIKDRGEKWYHVKKGTNKEDGWVEYYGEYYVYCCNARDIVAIK